MPRRHPAPSEGRPAHAGIWPRKGTPNRRTVEMRELMAALLNDVDYQHRLREDFRHRRFTQSSRRSCGRTSSASRRRRSR